MTKFPDSSNVLCETISSGTFKPVDLKIQSKCKYQVRLRWAVAGRGLSLEKELKHTTIPIFLTKTEFLKEEQFHHLVHKILLKILKFSLGLTSLHNLVFLSEVIRHICKTQNLSRKHTATQSRLRYKRHKFRWKKDIATSHPPFSPWRDWEDIKKRAEYAHQ